jgi:glycosyltransferase involved in cell wall biosynthesis
MHKLTVSVLIPCYNGGRFINRCLDAILKQTYDINLIKIIVVNDGSTDNSLELLQSYQKQYPNMVKIISQENHGVAYARNVLIANVETDFFMFCDVDDYYLPKAIKQMLAASENGKSDIVVSRTYRITANNKRKI